MKIHRSLRMTGEEDAVKNNRDFLQGLALKGEAEIQYASMKRQNNQWIYDGVLFVPRDLSLPLKDVTLNEFREVNYGVYNFSTHDVLFPRELNRFIEYMQEVKLDGISSKYFAVNGTDALQVFTTNKVEGVIQGKLPEILNLREIVRQNPQRLRIAKEALVTSKRDVAA